MSRLFELRFSADTDALLKCQYDECLKLPKVYSTIIGGLVIDWNIGIYPRRLKYGDGYKSANFTLVLKHDFPGNVKTRVQFNRLKSSRDTSGISDENFRSFVFAEGETKCFELRKVQLKPGKQFEGRFLVLIDPKDVAPSTFIKAQMNAFNVVDYGPVLRRFFEEGLAGKAEFCDAIVRCSDGSFRAASNVLRAQSKYFAGLFRFYDLRPRKRARTTTPEADGGSGLEIDLSESGYSVAVVSAVLQLVFTFSLPALEDWETAELGKLLKFGEQVNPDGLALLHATVEQTLLDRDGGTAAALGELATIADDHKLRILANATHVRLSQDPFTYQEELALLSTRASKANVSICRLGESLDEDIWDRVRKIVINRVDGISYERFGSYDE